MAIGAQRNCSGSNKLCLWMLSGGSAERGCTLPEHQWDADNNTVSLIVQDPASGLFYWIIVCLEKAKTGSIFSCKVSVSLCWFCVKSACFGSAVAKVEQDAWQGWKAACPGDQSCHSSWNPLGLAVRGWAAPARALLPVCLPQTSHCGFVGSQEWVLQLVGNTHQLFRPVSERGCVFGIKCLFHYLKSKLEAGELGHACKSMEDLVII